MEEVRRLNEEVPDDAPAWKATGYRVMRELVRGAVTRATAREAILIETRQYAKRQRTWFRHQLDEQLVTRIDPTDAHWRSTIDSWWRSVSPRLEERPA